MFTIRKTIALKSKAIVKRVKRKIRKLFSRKDTIETKSELINWLGKKYGYNSYLEISTCTTGNFFNTVNNEIFTVKECLNYYPPENNFQPIKNNTVNKDHSFELTDYQESLCIIRQKYTHFDIILVDPFHTFEQSFNDIITALSLVSPTGIIVVHDCNPEEEELIGNKWIENDWTGQTYESFIHFRRCYSYLETCVVDIDYGCGVIRPNYPSFNPVAIPQSMSSSDVAKWNYFTAHRKELLNLIDTEQFKKHCQSEQNQGVRITP